MKDIDKLIRHYVMEIVFVIVFVIISVPVWNMLDRSETAKIAKMYDTMDYLYLDVDKYISPDSFEDIVAVKNDTNTKRNFNLLIKISKEVDCENAIVIVNDNKYNLETIKFDENKEYNYYSITEDSLVAASKDYNISYENCNIKYTDVEYELIETEAV